MRSKLLPLCIASLLAGAFATAVADDGERLVRNVSGSEGQTADPEPEGEHAFIKLMNFHVPSQAASGELVPVEYYNIDGVLVSNTPTVQVIPDPESTDPLAPNNVCIIPDTDTNGDTDLPKCYQVDNPTSGAVFKCDSGKWSRGPFRHPATIKDCIGTNDQGSLNNPDALIVTATSAASLIQIP